ncbi:hypothetical protein BV22DRAFT_909974 [Leucogyrophana mollusca]|uniref:Uncharacterized protein n=1 Tax=Leucogyrophana mollusca TaxID=85980 RepID=A0ACB8AZF4_9AGAM|nr:hypothetical protein BV22DRAFT_909974 [Leucogyrophana mollusca]
MMKSLEAPRVGGFGQHLEYRGLVRRRTDLLPFTLASYILLVVCIQYRRLPLVHRSFPLSMSNGFH